MRVQGSVQMAPVAAKQPMENHQNGEQLEALPPDISGNKSRSLQLQAPDDLCLLDKPRILKSLKQSRHVMIQKALQPLLHLAHFFEVQHDRPCDIRNFYIPNELELQFLKTFVVVVVRI